MEVTQSNTIIGRLQKTSAVDLTGKEGRLAVLSDSVGAARVGLPVAITDRPLFVIDEGAALGEKSHVIPLSPDRQIRVKAKGAGAGGAPLCLAAIAGDDAGKLRAVPVAAGTYHIEAIAEEDFVDGQLVLVRRCSREAVLVA